MSDIYKQECPEFINKMDFILILNYLHFQSLILYLVSAKLKQTYPPPPLPC